VDKSIGNAKFLSILSNWIPHIIAVSICKLMNTRGKR